MFWPRGSGGIKVDENGDILFETEIERGRGKEIPSRSAFLHLRKLLAEFSFKENALRLIGVVIIVVAAADEARTDLVVRSVMSARHSILTWKVVKSYF